MSLAWRDVRKYASDRRLAASERAGDHEPRPGRLRGLGSRPAATVEGGGPATTGVRPFRGSNVERTGPAASRAVVVCPMLPAPEDGREQEEHAVGRDSARWPAVIALLRESGAAPVVTSVYNDFPSQHLVVSSRVWPEDTELAAAVLSGRGSSKDPRFHWSSPSRTCRCQQCGGEVPRCGSAGRRSCRSVSSGGPRRGQAVWARGLMSPRGWQCAADTPRCLITCRREPRSTNIEYLPLAVHAAEPGRMPSGRLQAVKP
jgi:hypothetical protein